MVEETSPLFTGGGRYTEEGTDAAQRVEKILDPLIVELVDLGYDAAHISHLFTLVSDSLASYHAGRKYREPTTV